MEKKLKKIAKDTNKFLIKFLQLQKRTDLIIPMKYGLLPGGKKLDQKSFMMCRKFLILITKK